MCVYVCVCMYVYENSLYYLMLQLGGGSLTHIHTYIHTYIRTYIQYMHTYIHVYVYIIRNVNNNKLA